MEGGVLITPHKRKKNETNFSLCVICQENTKESTRKDVKDNSIEKVIQSARDRYKYGDKKAKYKFCIENMKEQSVSELKQSCVMWHPNCYKWFTMETIEV